MMYEHGRRTRQLISIHCESSKNICTSIREVQEEETFNNKSRSFQRDFERSFKEGTRRSREGNRRAIKTITIAIILFWLSLIQALQVSCSSATYQDDKVAIIVTYKLGQWAIIARNGTKVPETFNVTSYSLIPVSVNNHTLKWGETLTLRAKANKKIAVIVQYSNRTIKLIFNVITAKEARKEIEKKLIELTLQELQNLKTKYVIIGALIGCIAILNGYLIKRRALLIERRAVLGLAFGFVMLSLFINMNISANYNEPPWYWIVYTISLLIATFSIPPPRGIYILEPELSKRNINLDYYAVYKDRRGVPRIAEQSVGAGLRRLFGIENDPVLVNGITKETMSLTTNWTLNYEDPLIISARSEFREIKLEGEGEEE